VRLVLQTTEPLPLLSAADRAAVDAYGSRQVHRARALRLGAPIVLDAPLLMATPRCVVRTLAACGDGFVARVPLVSTIGAVLQLALGLQPDTPTLLWPRDLPPQPRHILADRFTRQLLLGHAVPPLYAIRTMRMAEVGALMCGTGTLASDAPRSETTFHVSSVPAIACAHQQWPCTTIEVAHGSPEMPQRALAAHFAEYFWRRYSTPFFVAPRVTTEEFRFYSDMVRIMRDYWAKLTPT
jgi:hypothetical protein